jgi:hypothetical protein
MSGTHKSISDREAGCHIEKGLAKKQADPYPKARLQAVRPPGALHQFVTVTIR